MCSLTNTSNMEVQKETQNRDEVNYYLNSSLIWWRQVLMNYISWANKLTWMNEKSEIYQNHTTIISKKLLHFWFTTKEWVYSGFVSLLFCSLLDGCHTDLVFVNQPAVTDVIQFVAAVVFSNLWKPARPLHSPLPIICGCPFSVGLMTLTLRQGMGLRALTEVSNWYCPLVVFTTVLLQTMTASTSTSVDAREYVVKENVQNKKGNGIFLLYMHKYTYSYRREATPKHKNKGKKKT